MIIGFRLDASQEIGVGHLMRCLTLVSWLKEKTQLTCFFFTNRLPTGLANKIIETGAQHLELTPDGHSIKHGVEHCHWLTCEPDSEANQIKHFLTRHNTPKLDWLVYDHYGIDEHYHILGYDFSQRIMVIDDLADRNLKCDLVLDPTYQRLACDYEVVTQRCAPDFLMGTDFALLRREFSALRQHIERLNNVVTKPSRLSQSQPVANRNLKKHKILIFLGGGDPQNISSDVLHALQHCPEFPSLQLTLIIGSANQNEASLRQLTSSWHNITIIKDANNMAELMTTHDIAIGASGSTAWERCCLALPSIQITIALNQRLIAHRLISAGACFDGGDTSQEPTTNLMQKLDPQAIQAAISILTKNDNAYKKMVVSAAQICDGLGGERVATYLINKMKVNADT